MRLEIHQFNTDTSYHSERIQSEVILESTFTKEIRIVMKAGQKMKEHRSPFPIVIHLLEGEIEFGVFGSSHTIHKGQIFTLRANEPHDLKALANSIIRLTLSKSDSVKRVEKIIQD